LISKSPESPVPILNTIETVPNARTARKPNVYANSLDPCRVMISAYRKDPPKKGFCSIKLSSRKNQRFKSGTGVDTITVGAGSNVFDFGAVASIIGASLDTITDFKTGGSSNSVKFGLGNTSLVAVVTSTLVAGS
jgi:hypothetical protein